MTLAGKDSSPTANSHLFIRYFNFNASFSWRVIIYAPTFIVVYKARRQRKRFNILRDLHCQLHNHRRQNETLNSSYLTHTLRIRRYRPTLPTEKHCSLILRYLRQHPEGTSVENIILHSGADKLRVYPALFELEQAGRLEVLEREELGAASRVWLKTIES